MVEFGDEFEILNETPNGASPIIPPLEQKETDFS
jgi:hypothetical protein